MPMSPFAILIGLSAFLISLVTANPPLVSEIAGGPEAIKTQTAQNYEYVFSIWKAQRIQPSPPKVTADWCPFCVCADSPCIIGPPLSKEVFADWPGKPQFRSFAPQLPQSPALPLTATKVGDTAKRSVIVRAIQTPISEPSTAEHILDEEQQNTIMDRVQRNLIPNTEPRSTPDPARMEITDTFYTYALSGYHPIAIPLIVSSGHSNSPITILAYAKTTHFSSFISSSLIADLNRTSEIRPVLVQPLFTPERHLRNILGYETHSLGQISLDIVVGSRDRMIQDVNFTVFAAPEKTDTEGGWRPDLLVGMDFLNVIGGIKLTEEYSGSDGAGAKDGLPVLVQRVFASGCTGDCMTEKLRMGVKAKDEL